MVTYAGKDLVYVTRTAEISQAVLAKAWDAEAYCDVIEIPFGAKDIDPYITAFSQIPVSLVSTDEAMFPLRNNL